MNTDAVREYWRERALSIGDAKAVTHPDCVQRDMEVHAILKYLSSSDALLDVGCGTGYTTRLFADTVQSALGIDYLPEMVERAKQENAHPRARYECCDVFDLPYHDTFDVVVSIRMLINVLDEDAQCRAIDNMARTLRIGGKLLLMEGWRDGRHTLSGAREKVGLSPLPRVPYNLDLDEHAVLAHLARGFAVEEVRRFGTYDVLTRLFYPLVIAPEEPQYNTPFHEKALQLQEAAIGDDALGEYSRMMLIVARKQ